jgi:lysophospholipase L1-like esterase
LEFPNVSAFGAASAQRRHLRLSKRLKLFHARRTVSIALLSALAVSATGMPASSVSREQWVTTWATAQPLHPEVGPQGLKPPPKSASASPIAQYPDALANETVRMIVRVSTGGHRVRIELANAQGAPPLFIAAAHIARSREAATTVAGSDRTLRFGGREGVTIPPGATVTSDPANIAVRSGQKLAVSLFLPYQAATATVHALGLHTTYVISGDATTAQNPTAQSQNRSYFWLSAVDVLAPGAAAIVAFGDSITDGFATTPDKDQAWPTLLHSRLQKVTQSAGIGVLNLGLSGNRVLHDGAGANALARFDRDVLALEGVRWVVVLEGINDISYSAVPGFPASEKVSAQDLICGYRMLIAKAHMHGLKVIGATILPYEGVWTYTETGEAVRERVNEWIRSGGEFDSTVDFDKATRDLSEPKKLRAQFDSGDHVHPNDAGNQAMANAFNLTLFH